MAVRPFLSPGGLFRGLCLTLGLLLLASTARSDEALSRFTAKAFAGSPPAPAMLWLTPALKQRAARILGHEFPGLRVKYWREGERTAWVLDEIGKEQPITMGVVVEQGRIVSIEVLAYRESRGGEIRHEFFRRQFHEAGLVKDDKLDRDIDGISGATLSVRAMRSVARVALAFHQEALSPR